MVSRRSMETAMALLTGAFGAAVVVSSRENGIGWSDAGVDAGTFPFIVGLIISAGRQPEQTSQPGKWRASKLVLSLRYIVRNLLSI